MGGERVLNRPPVHQWERGVPALFNCPAASASCPCSLTPFLCPRRRGPRSCLGDAGWRAPTPCTLPGPPAPLPSLWWMGGETFPDKNNIYVNMYVFRGSVVSWVFFSVTGIMPWFFLFKKVLFFNFKYLYNLNTLFGFSEFWVLMRITSLPL